MLTPKQFQVYQFIRDYFSQFQGAPTEREIAEGIGIKSRGVVHRYVHALEDKGLLKVIPGKRRNIELVHHADKGVLPILGKIAAGAPIEAITDQKTFNCFDYFTGANRFVLRVKGDSMLGDHICDGDLVVCEQRDSLQADDIVVVLIDQQETTLKRIRQVGVGDITLLPSNREYQAKTYPIERVSLQGVLIGLLRLPGVAA